VVGFVAGVLYTCIGVFWIRHIERRTPKFEPAIVQTICAIVGWIIIAPCCEYLMFRKLFRKWSWGRMNAAEQREHKTRVDELADALEKTATAADERCTKIEALQVREFQALRNDLSKQQTHVIDLAKEQRSYVDTSDRQVLRNAIANDRIFFERNFGRRLLWLFFGK
jgi:hypothetical protein